MRLHKDRPGITHPLSTFFSPSTPSFSRPTNPPREDTRGCNVIYPALISKITAANFREVATSDCSGTLRADFFLRKPGGISARWLVTRSARVKLHNCIKDARVFRDSSRRDATYGPSVVVHDGRAGSVRYFAFLLRFASARVTGVKIPKFRAPRLHTRPEKFHYTKRNYSIKN